MYNNNSVEKILEKTMELTSLVNENLTVQENMEAMLSAHFPELDSKKVVSQILAGDAAVKNGLENPEPLDYKKMSEKELNKTFKMRAQNFNSMVDVAKEKFGIDTWEHIDENAVATIDSLKELDSNFDLLLDVVTPLVFDDKESAESLDENAGIIEFDDSRRYYLELAMYILTMEGEIDEIPAPAGKSENKTPYLIGAMAAGVFESIKAKLGYIKGKLTWDSVKKALKAIFKVVLNVLKVAGCFVFSYIMLGEALFIVMTKVVIAFLVVCAVFYVIDCFENGKAKECWDKIWAKTKNLAADALVNAKKAGQVLYSWFEALAMWVSEKALWIKDTASEKLNDFIQKYKTKSDDDDDDDDDDHEKDAMTVEYFNEQPIF